MKTNHITHYASNKNQSSLNEFEEAFYDSMLLYSLRHLTFIGSVSEENTMEALQKSLQVCYLAGINSKCHFKQIFVFDVAIGTLRFDWLMSKTGFNLMIIQVPLASEEMALWLWKLADHKTI